MSQGRATPKMPVISRDVIVSCLTSSQNWIEYLSESDIHKYKKEEFPLPSLDSPFSLLYPPSVMTSFRDHGVIIASLFLPNTVALTSDASETNSEASYFHQASAAPSLLSPAIPARTPGTPLLSIVDDLTVKVSTCLVRLRQMTASFSSPKPRPRLERHAQSPLTL